MDTLLSKEMLNRCVAPQSEIDEAVQHGRKMEFDDENGKLIAYLWKDKTYIIEMVINTEAQDVAP